SVLEEITDDLLYHGDLNAALRRMMQSGFRDRNGDRLQGLRDMLEQLRRRRRDTLERYDLGGVYDDIAQELRDIGDQERDALGQQLMQSYFDQMSGGMQGTTPEQMQRMKDMLSGLNQMLEQRERGEDTSQSFEEFMQRYGDFFPENPQSLDELLEVMAQRMAA